MKAEFETYVQARTKKSRPIVLHEIFRKKTSSEACAVVTLRTISLPVVIVFVPGARALGPYYYSNLRICPWGALHPKTKDILMGGFQHLHIIPIYEGSVRYRGIFSNLFWIYAIDIGFPEESRGRRPRADVRTKHWESFP